MIKSLYTRVVLTYLGSVIGGTIIALLVATWVYFDQFNENLKTNLLYFGQDIVRMYESFPLQEVDNYLSDMKQLNYYIRVYEGTGQFQSYGTLNGSHVSPITMDQVKAVLAGEVIQVTGVEKSLLGLPLTTKTGKKALFVNAIAPPSATFFVSWIFNFAAYSLIAGSLFILVAAMFLVRPIKELTKATRQIATGDFNVKLNIKQKGELGTLARSFEDMMHDLQQLEQMRRDFVSNVSHEVQSPLTSISGYAKALKQVNLAEPERSRYLDIIIAEAERMSKMSDSLLKLSLLESQTLQLGLSTFGLDEQIRRVIVALQPQWSARNIRFELNLNAVRLMADYDQLNQVWTNLIGNGIKFSMDGGVINVSIQQDINNVIVRISDTGIGISPEDQKLIFERFFKADRSHSRKYGGSGMGLAIVKQIISLHQGEIRVESEPGRGTTFIVILPMSAPADQSDD
ncbi:sensor histidine kinase [Paenibacillus graminis]|uniref:Heme sensor protein HssS n=1 Tax=Paenibacillus graminis TaxID=189425 RepID=A0A089MCN0_9BACL|nr:HAMP domain-containing sensor histidine kinase [Paenibacillus graminis]AIQ70130.1 histidine kinase [Paenibacillus graminis]